MKNHTIASVIVAAGRRENHSAMVMLILFFVLAAAATSVAASEPNPCITVDVRKPAGSGVIFADGFELGDVFAWVESAPTLSATEIVDVVFDAEVVGVIEGDHIVELKVRTQEGHLYQVLTAPITADGTRDGLEVKVEGFPYPLRLQALQWDQRSGRNTLTGVLRLPVAGTSIVTSSLYGSWTVDPYLDGQAAACEPVSVFTLVQ